MAELTINNIKHQVEVELTTPLLWYLRDTLNLTGTKYGCGIQQCGACTVLIKGRTVRSCGVSIEEVLDEEITTIEGCPKTIVILFNRPGLKKKFHSADIASLVKSYLLCLY